MKTNNEQLADLLAKHSKNRTWCAAMLGVDPSTVDRWLVPEKSPADKRRKNPTYRAMPTSALTLIRLLLREITVEEAYENGDYNYERMTA